MLLSLPAPAAIASGCDSALARYRARVVTIVASAGGNDFVRVVLPLEAAWADASDALAPERAAAELASGDEQNAAASCLERWSALQRDTLDSPQLFTRLRGAEAGVEPGSAERALTAVWVRRTRLAGAGVDANHRDEFAALQNESTNLQSSYEALTTTDLATITIGRRDLDGIPATVLALGSRKRDGSYILPIEERTQRVLEFATNEGVRKAYWLTREHHAESQRREVFARIVAVRDRLAHLMGYPTWSDCRLAGSMAGNTARIDKVLQSVARALGTAESAPWNASFDGADAGATAAYFPAAHTIGGALQLFQSLFSVRIDRDDGALPWATDTVAYRVSDASTNTVLGELLVRTGDAVVDQPSQVILAPRETQAHPAIVLATVDTIQDTGAEALDHAQLARAFGSIGDALATLLAATPYESLDLERPFDFRAILAQSFEQLAWQPEILVRISSDVRTGGPMDADRIAALLATRKNSDLAALSAAVAAAEFDIAAHTSGGRVSWETSEPVALDAFVHGADGRAYADVWGRLYANDVSAAFGRIRTAVLAPAGSLDPDLELQRLLGRPANPAAILQELAQ